MISDCRSIAQDIKDKIKNIIAEDDYAPILHIYQVGNNLASNAYIRGKLRDCEEVGIEAELIKLPEEITKDGLNDKIQEDYSDLLENDKVYEVYELIVSIFQDMCGEPQESLLIVNCINNADDATINQAWDVINRE